MKVTPLPLGGLLLIEPRCHQDARGFFLETYHEERYRSAGILGPFVQDNHAHSLLHTLRGMHFQTGPGQGKLVRAAAGVIFDVAVDLRPASTTFGRWHGVELDSARHQQLYLPPGFAHGYCVLSEEADVLYKVTTFYDAALERAFRWNDPEIGIVWPIEKPVLSSRDAEAKGFAAICAQEGLR